MYIYYAVKSGRIPGIYISYETAQKQIEGFKGAIYERFRCIEEAKIFLEEETIVHKISDLCYHAYVDGSYSEKKKVYSCGIVIHHEGDKEIFFFTSKNKKMLPLKNVAAEIEAALFAMEYVLSKKGKDLIIYYDFNGIKSFCLSQSEKFFIKEYRERYLEILSKGLRISFVKVKRSDEKHKEAHNACKIAIKNN